MSNDTEQVFENVQEARDILETILFEELENRQLGGIASAELEHVYELLQDTYETLGGTRSLV